MLIANVNSKNFLFKKYDALRFILFGDTYTFTICNISLTYMYIH